MTNTSRSAGVGVFGGSGFYKLLADVELVELSTPYGEPSDRIAIGTVAGRRVAFLSPSLSKAARLPTTQLVPSACRRQRACQRRFGEGLG